MSQVDTAGRVTEGSLFVTSDGTAYRLRDYSTDYRALKGWDRKGALPVTPSYTVLLVAGQMTTASTLPDDARLVWAPDLDGT